MFKKVFAVLALAAAVALPSSAKDYADMVRINDSVEISSQSIFLDAGFIHISSTTANPGIAFTPVQVWAGHAMVPQAKRVTGVELNLGWKRDGIAKLYGAGIGFINVADSLYGAQFGLANAAGDGVSVQGGLANIGDFSLAQAGVVNCADTALLQGGFIANISDHALAQASLINAADTSLAQAGFFNVSARAIIQGGAINTSDNLYGVSAWAVNIASSVCGLQGGLVNVAGKVYGVQFGAFNIADTLHGVQIGLLNIAGHALLPFMVGLNAGF